MQEIDGDHVLSCHHQTDTAVVADAAADVVDDDADHDGEDLAVTIAPIASDTAGCVDRPHNAAIGYQCALPPLENEKNEENEERR